MTDSQDLRTWYLDDADIDLAIAKIEKINKRAAKHGLEGRYTYTIGEVRRTPVYDDAGARLVIDGIPHTIEQGRPVPRPLIGFTREQEFIVKGGAPKLAGWTFIAKLTWDGGVLVTRCTPGFEGRIDDSLIRDGDCDHCHTTRARRDCYLVANADGDRLQVGSNCVKDFLGQDFRPSFVIYDDEIGNQDDFGSPRQIVDAPVADVLAWAASICGTTGWVSRAKAEAEYRTPSGEILRNVLFGWTSKAREDREKYQTTADHHAEAAKVLAWARAVEPGDSEYLANVRRVASAEWVGERNVAILGSAVASYHREQGLIAEREARPVSDYVGTTGERVIVAVTVKADTPIEGDYGVAHLYLMTDEAGNVFKWFSSRNQNWEVGQTVTIKGTVKGHESYRDVKQTQLTRCALVA